MNFSADFAVDRSNLVHPLLSSCLFYGKTMMEAWAMEEFAGAALGDERLNQRLVKLATRFADKPTASIPGACEDWSETQAAYRFFEQSSDQKRQLGLAGHSGAAYGMYRSPDAPASGGPVPARHDGAGFQWAGDGRTWATLPRSPARHVPAPDVRGDAGSRAARRNRCLDVGPGSQGG
jgi:hypothetical protein